MPTAHQDLYDAIKTMMVAVNAAVSQTIAQAPTNYGTDFRITAGTVAYQIQISPISNWKRSTVVYPRSEVSIAIFHYRTSLTTEETFLHVTLSEIRDKFLDPAMWSAESGVYGLDLDTEPEISEGALVGNVLVFELTATVLSDPA